VSSCGVSPVEEERDLEAFNRYSDELYGRSRTHDEELDWLRRQGPYAPRLVEALAADAHAYRAVVFFTYLYYPTYWGLGGPAAAHSVLVPTTHDEPPLRFGIYDEVFARPRAFAFLTPAEEALVRSRFDLRGRPAAVAGMGVDVPRPPDAAAFRRKYEIAAPYALYAGRIDAGKGCAELVAHYARYRARGGTTDLILIGTLAMGLPPVPGLRHLGYLSEDEKHAALASASLGRLPEPLREPVHLPVGGVRGGNAWARQRGVRGAQGALPPLERGSLLRGRRRVRRGARAPGRGFGPASRARGGGPAVRRGEYRWDVVLDRYRALIEAAAS
jgi:glycosyltransferase involved in cell wall biosynthesis